MLATRHEESKGPPRNGGHSRCGGPCRAPCLTAWDHTSFERDTCRARARSRIATVTRLSRADPEDDAATRVAIRSAFPSVSQPRRHACSQASLSAGTGMRTRAAAHLAVEIEYGKPHVEQRNSAGLSACSLMRCEAPASHPKHVHAFEIEEVMSSTNRRSVAAFRRGNLFTPFIGLPTDPLPDRRPTRS